MIIFRPLYIYILVSFAIISNTISAQEMKTVTVQLDGLKAPVTIRKDGRGIPYIEAKNDADLFFAQGYVTASDRLWQMELFRRVARGETAEIFGNRTLEEDKRWRRLGFTRIAEASLTVLSAKMRNALESYARGVNAYLATLDEKNLPPEFKILQFKPRPWTPTDTIVIGKILADGLSTTWRNDLLRAAMRKRLAPEKFADVSNIVTPYDVILFGADRADNRRPVSFGASARGTEPAIVSVLAESLSMAEYETVIRQRSLEMIGFYAEDLAASNNWVIAGKRTADGAPILSNDPHLQPTAPGIWYLTHLSTPEMRVSGVTLPGAPGITLGHNEFIAWGATNVGPDVQDLYLETFNAEGKYKTPNGWESPDVRPEVIKVRKNLVTVETEPVQLDVVETRNGVIYSEEGGQKFSLKWTARDPKNGEFEAFYFLNRAKNWTDFENALKAYGGATQNFVYADTKGNIGWIAGGRIPIRRTGDGAYPYDGTTNQGEWIGYIPFNELPRLYNPPGGFIVTANQRIIGQDYKYQQMARDVAAPWRARRIVDLIGNDPKVDMNEVTAMLRDSYSIPHTMLAKELIKLDAASPETIALLKGWDGRMSADSRAALLINAIRNAIADRIAEDNKPLPSFVARERLLHLILHEKPPRWLPNGFASYTEFFKAADRTARETLQKQFGNDESKWIWGALFKANFPHPLAGAPLIGQQFAAPNIGIDGSGVTPNVGSGVSMRHIATPFNWDNTRQVIPLGQSGIPQNSHYKDQFDSWNKGELPLFPFSKTAVDGAARETIVLSPK
jgi:penicillin amidase